MASFSEATVLDVRHWNDTLFSFKTTRDQSLRFRNGHFVMLGLAVEGKPLMRAYSIASPNYAEYLEFLSIKVENGPLTSRLQHIAAGDRILLGQKTVGTLVIDDLRPGKRLFLFATGRPRVNAEPILTPGVPATLATVTDPLPQALVLTAIVIGVGVTALMLAYAYRLYEKKHSLDIGDFTELKG